uniref:Uncharacterized protein n=1 Tax=Timema shepardi TaxID=629360 RepID=A0A7R9ASQ3_TIMSH|nr:unnamed protein product [Timema shepardi]
MEEPMLILHKTAMARGSCRALVPKHEQNFCGGRTPLFLRVVNSQLAQHSGGLLSLDSTRRMLALCEESEWNRTLRANETGHSERMKQDTQSEWNRTLRANETGHSERMEQDTQSEWNRTLRANGKH